MDLDYFETFTITLIFLSIFVGGIVKGSVGIGMSMFSVPIIAFILPPTKAMMLLCFPVIITNLIQMNIKQGISNYRFLPMFLLLFIGILIGGKLILKLNFQTISIIIAITIIFFTLVNFFGLNLKNIKEKDNGKVTDDALKLIVKISEGSVRDALSLLDLSLIHI